MTTTQAAPLVRRRLQVRGIVQGVGFRPFVYRLATEAAVAGWVRNDTDGVTIEVQGPPEAVHLFEHRLVHEPPPLARIDQVEASPAPVGDDDSFRIVDSASTHGRGAVVAPDVAVCEDCLRELADPTDRRFGYPLTNCTNCGPRFTITVRLPYDRPNTTMAGFPVCEACAAEYGDPANRRYHAQPVACPACGPAVRLEPAGLAGPAAIAQAREALSAGLILAVKGVGGYHLACDAANQTAVAELRRRKRRPAKPLAVMVPDLEAAHRLGRITGPAAELLTSRARPIVLVPRLAGGGLAAAIAPGNPYLGLMLPYTPVHHLLFVSPEGPEALVMTSGNLSEEPICYDDGEARRRLGAIADAWLVHDRPIHVPCDDSVFLAGSGCPAGSGLRAASRRPGPVPVRRSRGYAPVPIALPFDVPPLLAAGGDMKNAFCLATGRQAWMSQHLGDMGSAATLAAFERSVAQFTGFYGVTPRLLAADLHPGYMTRSWAEGRAGEGVALVQHHHAHVASVMAEGGVAPGESVIGVAFDGTGLGTDGAVWGGEFLIASYRDFERAAHLRYVTIPAGDRAAREPYLAALAHLHAAGIDWEADLPPVAAASAVDLQISEAQINGRLPGVPTSSMGRLFDAVAALLGIRQHASYEAQAAIELQASAAAHIARVAAGPGYRFELDGDRIDPRPVLAAIAADLRSGRAPGEVAAAFHLAVASMIADVALALGRRHGLRRVALSGGVFQNDLLLGLTHARLAAEGFEVLTHSLVPPNDAGLALGQAVVAGSSQ
ncbi:MAG TPA: carbamoyltransferase HypF [Acidimicrobiales bacterium]|nr:carbamoyltransferase HypF [Acidimicrobiales bacterium]